MATVWIELFYRYGIMASWVVNRTFAVRKFLNKLPSANTITSGDYTMKGFACRISAEAINWIGWETCSDVKEQFIAVKNVPIFDGHGQQVAVRCWQPPSRMYKNLAIYATKRYQLYKNDAEEYIVAEDYGKAKFKFEIKEYSEEAPTTGHVIVASSNQSGEHWSRLTWLLAWAAQVIIPSRPYGQMETERAI